MAFAVCVLLFCAVSPLMYSLSQQMVLFSFWEASAVANRILVNAGEYVDIFSDIQSALRHKESKIQAPERDSIPAQQFERLHHYPVAASFPAEIGRFPNTSNRRYELFVSALVPYIFYLDYSFVVDSYSYCLRRI